MRKTPLIVTTALLAWAAALAQLRITSFNPNGELTWTNPPVTRAFYSVEAADTPAGPWNAVTNAADLDWSATNRLTAQVPETNAQAFYRVAWQQPAPLGVWDYRGYDQTGTLVITGRLNVTSMNLTSSKPPVIYRVLGSWDFRYAGPPTNQLWWLGPQIPENTFDPLSRGATNLAGTATLHDSQMRLFWPTNVVDSNIYLMNTLLGPNTYTGRWVYSSWGGEQVGPFSALKLTPPANLGSSPLTESQSQKGESP